MNTSTILGLALLGSASVGGLFLPTSSAQCVSTQVVWNTGWYHTCPTDVICDLDLGSCGSVRTRIGGLY